MTTMERSPTTLFVRHLPDILDDQEKVDLLCHFGADRVRVMGANGGSMKHTAFAQFDEPLAAELALGRLHQLEILGHKLVVEYARVSDQKTFPTDKDKRKENVDVKTADDKDSDVEQTAHGAPLTADNTFQKHNIPYPKNPTLRYFYPPPTVSTLTNIANALASHPRFYVQVLHLMNKMNLPAPFGTVTPTPPLAQDAASRRSDTRTFENSSGPIDEVEMEYCSTEESELESDADSTKPKPVNPQANRLKRPRKRMKVLPPVHPEYQMQIKPLIIATASDIFEQAERIKSYQIQFNLSATELKTENFAPTVVPTEGSEGFGKIEPSKPSDNHQDVQKPEVNYKIDPKLFITKSKIMDSRLSESQIKEFSVFKGYKSGETTSRLYIKNLHKHTTEQDLVNLFGGYVNWDQELSYHIFDVRLMKEGRMKGQAFVTMPSEEAATRVVRDCNGYIQNGKPMVIQFARSAKAKDTVVKK